MTPDSSTYDSALRSLEKLPVALLKYKHTGDISEDM